MNPKLLALYNKLAEGKLLTEAECRELADLELVQIRDVALDFETRGGFDKLTTRAADETRSPGSPGVVSGRPAKFNNLSKDLGGFKENILPGAFANSLAKDDEEHDVRALVGHDKNRILGRRSAGTLEIREDKVGLEVDIYTLPTTEGRDAYLNVKAGNLNAMSFGFKAKKVRWRQDQGIMVRDLVEVDLKEVSLVGLAAYNGTELAAREHKDYGKGVVAYVAIPINLLRLRRKRMEMN